MQLMWMDEGMEDVNEGTEVTHGWDELAHVKLVVEQWVSVCERGMMLA